MTMSNQGNLRKGVCQYCGQIRMVTAKAAADQEDVDKKATKNCDCPEATIQRKHDEQYESACRNIEEIFQDNQDMAEILKRSARMIADVKIDAVSVKCGEVTGKINATSKGTIKTSRTEKDERSLES